MKSWLIAKWRQLLILVGLAMPESFYMYKVVQIRYGNRVFENLLMDEILLEIDYPYTWGFNKLQRRINEEKPKGVKELLKKR